ncbi:MAG: helix-turn-helix transcriptional regulator [Pseudomonadota bacterium]
MAKITNDELKELINALQLSISSKIVDGVLGKDSETVVIKFEKRPANDKGWMIFEKIIGGGLDKNGFSCSIDLHNYEDAQMSTITSFLMLSRLKKDNMKKLAELDAKFEGIAKKIGIDVSDYSPASTVQDISKRIFNVLGEKKMTIRELSLKTGLTPVALSRFKAGNDIRLSSLLKIIKALGMRLGIK